MPAYHHYKTYATFVYTRYMYHYYLDQFEETITLGAIEEIYDSPKQGVTGESLEATLSALKPRVLTALNNRTYLTSLHKKLATKAESLKIT